MHKRLWFDQGWQNSNAHLFPIYCLRGCGWHVCSPAKIFGSVGAVEHAFICSYSRAAKACRAVKRCGNVVDMHSPALALAAGM